MAQPPVRPRVLIIDDEQDVVTYLESVLNDNGFEATGTTDGAEGLALARRLRPDLICLDVVMPPPTGVRVYRDLRGDPALAAIPVVMVTGVQKEFKGFIHHRKLVRPPDAYVSKPFDVAELLATLRRLLPAAASA